MYLFERWGNMDLRATSNGGSLDSVPGCRDSEHDLGDRAVVELDLSRSYASTPNGGLNNTLVPNYTYRVAASYVTGTHSFKTGWNDTFGHLDTYNYAYQPIAYTFLNTTPTSVTECRRPVHLAQQREPRLWRIRAGHAGS